MHDDMWSHGKNRMASTLERLLEPPKPKKKWYHCLLCCYRPKSDPSDKESLSVRYE